MELTLLKMSGGVLAPSTPADAEAIKLMPIGTTILAKGKGRRNLAFLSLIHISEPTRQ